MQGPVGPAGMGGGPSYEGEMYDDCRDAFGPVSPTGLRRLMAASGEDLGELTDDDVRWMVRLGCWVMASGGETILAELLTPD